MRLFHKENTGVPNNSQCKPVTKQLLYSEIESQFHERLILCAIVSGLPRMCSKLGMPRLHAFDAPQCGACKEW